MNSVRAVWWSAPAGSASGAKVDGLPVALIFLADGNSTGETANPSDFVIAEFIEIPVIPTSLGTSPGAVTPASTCAT